MEQKRMPVFAERFAELRGDKTQGEFAEFLGISRPTVGFYENGTRLPDAAVLCQIAKKCGVSADWLLGISEYKGVDSGYVTAQDMGLTEDAASVFTELINKFEDGRDPAGFSEGEYCPKKLINDILTHRSFFVALIEACDGIADGAKEKVSVRDILEARNRLPSLMKRGIGIVSPQELAILRIEHAKSIFSIILEDIVSSQWRKCNYEQDEEVPTE